MQQGVYGCIKVVTTIFYVGYLVDRIGRRLPLIVGATIQGTSMLYLALYIRFAGKGGESVSGTPAGGIVGVVFIYLYAFGWSFGHSVACYVVAAEIFPTRIVSTLTHVQPWLPTDSLTAFSLHVVLLLRQLDCGLWHHSRDA